MIKPVDGEDRLYRKGLYQMKAVILAAGIGSRLRPITDQKPKTMVKVNGRPMIAMIIEALFNAGITQIVICVGFKKERLMDFCKTVYPHIDITYVDNSVYDSTNNMYSLYLAKDYLDDDILLMNADLIFDASIVKELAAKDRTCVAVDKGRYIEESMKIAVEENIIRSISKKIPIEEAYGSSIDIYKILKKDIAVIIREMKSIIELRNDRTQWTEVMLDNLFQSGELIAHPFDIENKKWVEIDDFNDLSLAEMMFNLKAEDIKSKKVFFFDRDGTLSVGDMLLEGAQHVLQYLKEHDKLTYIVTNNSSMTPQQHYEGFRRLGLDIRPENVLVSTQSALEFFKMKKIQSVFYVANKTVSEYFMENGIVYTEVNPQAILVTYDNELTYDKLQKLVKLVRSRVPFFATHKDIVCPTAEGDIPDIGTILSLVEQCTGIKPDMIFGKPDMNFIKPLLRKHNLIEKDAVIIGDRLYTDVLLAENSEVLSVLVLTGETKRDVYEDSTIQADVVLESVQNILEFI